MVLPTAFGIRFPVPRFPDWFSTALSASYAMGTKDLSSGLKQPDCEADLSPYSGSETKNSSTHNMQDMLWCLPRLRKIVTHFMQGGITGMSQV